ncbi:MAG: hypothetical protein ACHQ1H_02945 [Nitrososphaerales archaeon]
MPTSSDRFQLFAREFDSLVLALNVSPSVEDRTKLLRRMKVLIVEIDMLILSNLKRENHDTTRLPRAEHPAADS